MAEFLNNNVKHLRNMIGISQQTLADKIGVDRSTISRIENGEIETTIDNASKLAKALNVELNDLVAKDLTFDNANYTDITSKTIPIPVLGIIKAGIPIEAQENIIDYVEIPKDWTKGNKIFFALKIDGNSMFPKYQTNDIVIFEQSTDIETANNKDCAVMVNGDDATFKKIMISEKGVTLVPYNIEYEPLFFTPDEVENKPVRIIGIAREKRTKII